MEYEKLRVPVRRKVKGRWVKEEADYIRWVKTRFPKAIYQAPDTPAGRRSLDRRRMPK